MVNIKKQLNIVFFADIIKPYTVIIWFNLCSGFCRLPSVSALMTWSYANSSFDGCWFFESLIPFMSWLCHLVTISSKYITNCVGERGRTWTDYKTNAQIAKELKTTPILDKLLEYKRSWIQHVNIIVISNLSNDRSKASSKTIPPHSAI